MDSNQEHKDSQDFHKGRWERTGIQPFPPSPIKMVLPFPSSLDKIPGNEVSRCSPQHFITVPTPWKVKEEGMFPVLSRRPLAQPKTTKGSVFHEPNTEKHN